MDENPGINKMHGHFMSFNALIFCTLASKWLKYMEIVDLTTTATIWPYGQISDC